MNSPFADPQPSRFDGASPIRRTRPMSPSSNDAYVFGGRANAMSTSAGARSLSLLNEVRTGVVPSISQAYGDHRALAMQLANAVLSALGLRLPSIAWTQGDDAYALGNKIVIGNRLAQSLPLPALTQLILHEAGHVHEGHANVATGLILQALVQNGHLDPRAYNAMMRDEERVADVYAAIGAWMFDPGERPGLATWLAGLGHPETDTHPASRERAMMIEAIVRALDAALYSGL